MIREPAAILRLSAVPSIVAVIVAVGLASSALGDEAKPGTAKPAEPAPTEAAKPGEPPPTEAAKPGDDDHTLDRYRSPFEALNDRKIGEASRAVRFDWRKTTLGFGIVASDLLELNNFSSARFGGFVRKALGSLIVELAVTWVFSWSESSAQLLEKTPYRQFGRPERLEVDINGAFPLAEGVATARPGFFPATELVFSVNVGIRYLFYPGALGGGSAGDVASSLFAPKLSQREIDYLDRKRQPAMRVDPARYGLLAGFSLDVYFQTGGFLEPRVLVGIPVFSALNGGGLGLWWELSLSLGWAI